MAKANAPIAVTATVEPEVVAARTDNPVGIKDEEGTLRLMLLIALANQSKPTPQHHEM